MNQAVIAAAGSRKTQQVVDAALEAHGRVLVLTYTNRNQAELIERIESKRGVVPPNIEVRGWFDFLMAEMVRPYQQALTGQINYLSGLNFIGEKPRFAKKADIHDYFFDSSQRIYRNGVADFALQLNNHTDGKVIDRLEQRYDHILVDEFQDLVAFDLDILDLLLKSSICILLVGDPRQFILETSTGPRNKKYRGMGIMAWLAERKTSCELEHRDVSHRCSQAVLDFANSIFPDQKPATAHHPPCASDGVTSIDRADVLSFCKANPDTLVLRHDSRSDTLGLSATNIGVAKGATHDHVVLFPTRPMLKFFQSGDLDELKPQSRAKLYVAVTRARFSVRVVS